jgi:hypothetical protein
MSSTEYRYQSLVSRKVKTPLLEWFSKLDLKSGSKENREGNDGNQSMFRLLTLHSGVHGSPISCELQVVPIRNPPKYEALSYVWGDPTVTKEIRLSGKPFHITTNLESALQRLRLSNATRYLWVDAICIDQTNLPERSGQVQMMAKIFSGAASVLVWLGEADQYTNSAFDAVEDLCSVAKYRIWKYCSAKTGVPMRDLDDTIVQRFVLDDAALHDSPFFNEGRSSRHVSSLCAHLKLTQSRLSNGTDVTVDTSLSVLGRYFSVGNLDMQGSGDVAGSIEALNHVFLRNSWWWRIWVIQEAVCATCVLIVCGTRELWLDHIYLAYLGFSNNKLSSGDLGVEHEVCKSISKPMVLVYRRLFTRLDEEAFPTDSLASLLHSYWDKQCSYPRDKIFALLSLVKSSTMTADYTKREIEIYIEATRSMILESQLLQISCMILKSALQVEALLERGLPTWVPDFSKQRAVDQLVIPFYSLKSQDYHSVVKLAPYDTALAKAPRVLKLYAILCDTMEVVHERIHRETGWNNSEVRGKKLRQWMPIGNVKYPTGESHADVFWRTLLQDRYESLEETGRHIIEGRINQLNRIPAKKLFMLSAGIVNDESSDEAGSADLTGRYPYTRSRFEEILKKRVMYKTFCITARGYMGMVGGGVQVGDRVCVARGSPVPLIIRPLDDERVLSKIKTPAGCSRLWTLVGPAYIHGIMDGEVEIAAEQGDFREDIIYLA